jgi:hypothetical protein
MRSSAFLTRYRIARRMRDYKPQAVTLKSINRWLNQFPKEDQPVLLELLAKIRYISEKETRDCLVSLNERLLQRLDRSGIPVKNVIYVQVHDAGSSSPVMLNVLRNAARLERRGCGFLDSRDILGLQDLTNRLEEGAIVYVDDFAGTGNQFCAARDYFAEYILGTFAEFFLLPCICEEALYNLGKRGVEAFAGSVHSKAERPLHENSIVLDPSTRTHVTELCRRIDRNWGLGYHALATMVVFDRDCPNTVPLVFRGNIGQHPWWGILPRTADLPAVSQ